MSRLAVSLITLSALALAAPARADHDYYPRYHHYSAHCDCYRCARYRSYYDYGYDGYRDYGYDGYRDYGYRGYHPRSYVRPYRRGYYRPYGGYYGGYRRRGFSYYGPHFSFSFGR